MPKISRRDLLKFVGAGSVGVAGGVLYGEGVQNTAGDPEADRLLGKS